MKIKFFYKKTISRLVLLLLIGCAAMLLSACGAFVTSFVSPLKTYSLTQSIELKSANPDILKTVSDVGKEMGYSLQGMDDKEKSVTLKYDKTSMAESILIGNMNTVTMEIIAKENGKLLVVNCNFMGNFGASEHESSMKIYNDFKQKILEKTK